MQKAVFEMDIPSQFIPVMGTTKKRLPNRVKELIALELFREGKITTGKAAELVGIHRMEFIHLLAKNDIPFFTQKPEELEDEINLIEGMIKNDRSL